MTASIILTRTPGGLSPATPYDAELLDGYPMGATVEARVHQRRSVPHHRFFWKACSELVKAGAVPFATTDQFVDALKMACGVTELRQGVGGAPYIVPGSISFAAKDQAAFKAFTDRAAELIARHYGVTLEQAMEAA